MFSKDFYSKLQTNHVQCLRFAKIYIFKYIIAQQRFRKIGNKD